MSHLQKAVAVRYLSSHTGAVSVSHFAVRMHQGSRRVLLGDRLTCFDSGRKKDHLLCLFGLKSADVLNFPIYKKVVPFRHLKTFKFFFSVIAGTFYYHWGPQLSLLSLKATTGWTPRTRSVGDRCPADPGALAFHNKLLAIPQLCDIVQLLKIVTWHSNRRVHSEIKTNALAETRHRLRCPRKSTTGSVQPEVSWDAQDAGVTWHQRLLVNMDRAYTTQSPPTFLLPRQSFFMLFGKSLPIKPLFSVLFILSSPSFVTICCSLLHRIQINAVWIIFSRGVSPFFLFLVAG